MAKKRRRLKKSVKKALKSIGIASAAAIASFCVIPNTRILTPVHAEYQPFVRISTSADIDAEKAVEEKNNMVVAMAEKSNLDTDTINKTYSSVSVEDVSTVTKGLQKGTVTAAVVDDVDGSVNYVKSQAYIVVEQDCLYPTLELTTSEITFPNDGLHTFVAENYISKVNDSSGILPVLSIASNVDSTIDGEYSVTYKAVNTQGNAIEKTLTVHVETPQWLIDQRNAEAAEKARIEAEKKAEEERKAQEEAERQRQIQLATSSVATNTSNLNYSAGGNNPYAGGWSNCTWGAWQALYNSRNISLPNMGNAYEWVGRAQSMGYATGTTPAAGSIAVYTNHVAYVDAVDGDRVHIVEGGYNGHYMERWVGTWSEGTQALRGYIYP